MNLLPTARALQDGHDRFLLLQHPPLKAHLPGFALIVSRCRREFALQLLPIRHSPINCQLELLLHRPTGFLQDLEIPERRVNRPRHRMDLVERDVHVEIIGIDVGAGDILMIAKSQCVGIALGYFLEIVRR